MRDFTIYGCISCAALLSVVAMPASEPPEAEPCGIPPSQRILYEAPSGDRFEPDPRVIAITGAADHPEIRVAVNLEGGQELREAIIRTLDGGRSWQQLSTRTREYAELSHDKLKYRVSLDGKTLERSSDDGIHWERAILDIKDEAGAARGQLRFELAAIHPTKPETIYGCFDGNPAVFVSVDAGDNWSTFYRDAKRGTFDEPCLLAINASNPQIMVAHGKPGVVVSHNGGLTWETVGDAAELERPAELVGYSKALGKRREKGLTADRGWPYEWTYLAVMQVEFFPGRPNTFFLVTNKGVFRTDDGGRSWRLLETGTPKVLGVQNLYIDPIRNGRIFIGTNNSIMVSDDLGCHFRIFLSQADRVETPRDNSRRQGTACR